jgi:fatty acid desaturase
MPFNEKGEFIRSAPARPSPTGAATQPRREVTRSAGKQSNTIWWVIGTIAALAALVGIAWVLWLIREWLMLAFGVWVAAQIRGIIR